MDNVPISTPKSHRYRLWVVALALAVGVAFVVNYWASRAQSPTYGYTINRIDTNANTAAVGSSVTFNYTLTNVGNATGTDTVNIEVLNENWQPVSWCAASPASVTVSGVGGTASFNVVCTPAAVTPNGPNNLYIRTNSSANLVAGSWSTNSIGFMVNVQGGASAEYYSYSFAREDTASTSIQYGINSVFSYRITQTDTRASGSDTVTFGVYQNSAPATWCYVQNPNITMTGPSATQTFAVICNPTAAQLGSPSLIIKVQSLKEQAAGRPGLSEISLNLTIIAPTAGNLGASVTDIPQNCYYNASTSAYVWYATPPGPNWTAMPNSSCPTGTPPGTSNMVNHTWNFKDGQTSNSMILNRTDSEYTNYIAQIHAQCMTINMNQFGWKQNAGDSGSSNWQNFGIPDCSGTAVSPNPTPDSSRTCYQKPNGTYVWMTSAEVTATSEMETSVIDSLCSGTNPNPGTANSNWVNKIWNFKDGQTATSYILNRTDAEYSNYIAQVQAACLLINKNQMSWKSGAGNDAASNWQNFGIPDCAGTAVIPPTPGPTPTPTPGTASSCYKNNSDSSYSWFSAGTAGPNWTAVDRSFCDAMMSTCYKNSDGTYQWVTPTGFMETDWVAVADSFCSNAVVPPTPTPAPGACKPGTKCPESSWCDMGNRCFYPDGQISCTVGWDSACPSGAKYCRPGDTNCIEPGSYGPLSGWCTQSMECYTDTQKYCTPTGMAITGGMPKCPAGTKYCSPGDTNCIEPGGKGPSSGWCKNSQSCYLKDGSGVTCVEWQGRGTAAGAEGGYTAPMTAVAMSQIQCPAGSGYCRPDDKNCIEPGSSGPKDGWCAGGSPNRCFRTDGTLFCPKMGEACPSDSSVCPSGDSLCIEPGKYGPENGWCGGSASVMCYKANRGGVFCGKVDSYDPVAWSSFKCPSGTSRCREDDKYCLEVGETCESNTGGCWCVSGRIEYKNGKSTCVNDMPGKEEDKKEEEKFACFKHKTNVRDYARLSISKAGTDWEPAEDSYCSMFALSCYKKPDGTYVSVSSTGAIETTWVGVDREYCAGSKKDDQIICAWNPNHNAVQTEMGNLGRMEKSLNFAEGDVKLKDSLRVQIKNAYKTLESLAKQAIETSCGARDGKAFETAFQKFRNEVMGPIEEAFRGFGDQGDLANLGREIKMRLEYLANDKERFLKQGDAQAVSQIEEWIQAHKALQTDLEAKVNPQEIRAKLTVIEDEMKVFFEGRQKEGRDEFLGQMIENMRQNLAMARQAIIGRPAERCKAAAEAVEKIATLVNDAEGPYRAGEVKTAAAILEKAEKAMHQRLAPAMQKCMGDKFIYERVDVRDNFENVIGVSAEAIDDIVERVTEKMGNKIQLLMSEAMKEAAARLTELQQVAQEKVAKSLEQIQAVVNEQYREVMAEIKKTMIEKTQVLERLAEEAKATLRASDRNRLYRTLEMVSTYNWCGRLGEELQAEADIMIMAFENGKVKTQDITDFEKKVGQAAAENGQACYASGVSRFIDTPTHEWYFGSFQDPRWQGTRTAAGQLTGNVEPGRPTLAAEAMITVMRSAGYENIEGECAVVNASAGANAPVWATCAANAAAYANVLPAVPLNQPIEREAVAQMLVKVMGDRGVLEAADLALTSSETEATVKPYSDISSCDVPQEVIATMVESGLMVGNEGIWNCDGQMNRAELATVLVRFDEMMEFYSPENR